jgi:predicted small secreted protein
MKDSRMKKVLVALTLVVMGLSGCATVEGVGRDISGGANRVNDWIN